MDKRNKCLDCQGNIFLTSVTFSVVNILYFAVLVCSITNDNALANGIAVSILIAFLLQAEKSRNQVGFSTTSYVTLCPLRFIIRRKVSSICTVIKILSASNGLCSGQVKPISILKAGISFFCVYVCYFKSEPLFRLILESVKKSH